MILQVFGGFERETGRVFMVPVEKRDAQTLVGIIKEWILPGTTIISGKYGQITFDSSFFLFRRMHVPFYSISSFHSIPFVCYAIERDTS